MQLELLRGVPLALSTRMNQQQSLGPAWATDAMGRLADEIQFASRTDARVLITGESGVGKRFAAHMIHHLSPRRRDPFVAVAGADAVDRDPAGEGSEAVRQVQQGLLQTSHRGTLLIQEIENLPLSAQPQFLRFVDGVANDGSVRLMAATSVDLFDRVHAGTFHDDLFYRLNTLHIVIPPLRERPEDIPMMFHYYLALHSRAEIPQLSSAARQRLVEYPWPGNVSEMKTVTMKLCAQDLPDLIEPQHLPCPIGG